MTSVATATITADELHELVGSSAEYALVDVREAGVTANEGSILLAVSIPLSFLEIRVRARIPRLTTPVIVYDGGDGGGGLAERASAKLSALGYTDVRLLNGGLRAWADAGHKVQSGGDHVIGQAFGEWIEHVYETPHISVADFRDRVAAGEDIILLDSRPIGEFENHSLPGGTSIPGAELVYRAAEVVKSPDTLVVVNCAGRTRSILGAQVLINAGLPNKVVSLEGGTQSWVLEGHELVHGKSVAAPEPGASALESAQAAAATFAQRFAISTIDKDTLATFRAEADKRSLYVLDVRTPGEYEAGHLPGSRSAPSWDVAPWTFRHVGTHNARIVLVDNDSVRATVAASWITQIGWGEVFVLENALDGVELETGPASSLFEIPTEGYDLVEPAALQAQLDDVTVIDVSLSPAYRAGHIPGARFAIRSRLAAEDIPGDGTVVLTSEDSVIAAYAAAELSSSTDRSVQVLDGGTASWKAAGLPVETGAETWLSEPDDIVASGWRESDPERRKAGFRRYLSWELGLVAELDADDTVPFKRFD
ncbi:rhodanese-like domain-containing protein [Mycobacterium sp. 236(2023)]|uniref:rhodanese-like domain-containing protein n=1 Tax=Mycobacterium sp. 236(2023) TaxID=3038163 RepID=UPI002414D32F|nr:rhodanese-like domain-containing protein [Mycobacterium sp. 236(2023)]MDG4667629.1 rhodanese-like domain-containing protein [Mycobacterium sp. 236(2023)]